MRNEAIKVINSKTYIKNIQPLNDNISKCDLMILYEGLNRNYTYLSKETIENFIAPSLPNKPIVGYYDVDKQDFLGHEQALVIDPQTGELSVRYITVPFGVIAGDTKIWWEDYIDVDGVKRTYLCCQGYIWSGRYPETQDLIQNGKNVSMELRPDSIKGYWSKIDNSNKEYYIITEASIDAICILGDDIEPCFEGASIRPVEYGLKLEHTQEFDIQMNEFMSLLKEALNYELNLKKGGKTMEVNKENVILKEENGQDVINSTEENVNNIEDNFSHGEPIVEEAVASPIEEEPALEVIEEESHGEIIAEEFEKQEEEEEIKTKEEEEEEKVDYAAMLHDMTAQYNEMVEKYEQLKVEYEKIKEQLGHYILKEKQEIINKYTELSEEDIADIKNNLEKYTLEELDLLLAAKAYNKIKTSFSLKEEKVSTPTITFNLNDSNSHAPAWVKTILNKKNK